jgi:hypothetical protein
MMFVRQKTDENQAVKQTQVIPPDQWFYRAGRSGLVLLFRRKEHEGHKGHEESTHLIVTFV